MTTQHLAPPEEKASSEPGVLRAFVRGIRAALTLLTRIPVGGFPYSDHEWRWSAAHLPLVGSLLGMILGGVWLVGARAGFTVAAILVVAASMLLTGAIHEDGLADTADALGGGSDRRRILEILKDSRIGSFGGAALTVAILLRVALLARLGTAVPVALVLTGAASRLTPVWLMAALPYVTDPAVAKHRSIVAVDRPQVVVATIWLLLVTSVFRVSNAFSAIELAATWGTLALIAVGSGLYYRARVGGITGDFLGATQQVSECGILFAVALVRGGSP